MSKIKEAVVDAISEAIENQARTTLFLRLDESKTVFKKQMDKIGFGIMGEREELTNIVDFLMEKDGATKEMIWDECSTLRGKLIDYVVGLWKNKRP